VLVRLRTHEKCCSRRLLCRRFRTNVRVAGPRIYLSPSDHNPSGQPTTMKTVWHKILRHAKIPHFQIYDFRSRYATSLSAGGALGVGA
jgi:hypothetical protein